MIYNLNLKHAKVLQTVIPVFNQEIQCLAQGQNTVPPVRLEPATPRSRVKLSNTEPLRSSLADDGSLIVAYRDFSDPLEKQLDPSFSPSPSVKQGQSSTH